MLNKLHSTWWPCSKSSQHANHSMTCNPWLCLVPPPPPPHPPRPPTTRPSHCTSTHDSKQAFKHKQASNAGVVQDSCHSKCGTWLTGWHTSSQKLQAKAPKHGGPSHHEEGQIASGPIGGRAGQQGQQEHQWESQGVAKGTARHDQLPCACTSTAASLYRLISDSLFVACCFSVLCFHCPESGPLTCPDLPCPALPCPALPCPALPCPD